LFLRKIIKIVATRCRILKLKCTKFDLVTGELTSLPRSLAGYEGILLSEVRGRKREGKGKVGEKGGDLLLWRGRRKGMGERRRVEENEGEG